MAVVGLVGFSGDKTAENSESDATLFLWSGRSENPTTPPQPSDPMNGSRSGDATSLIPDQPYEHRRQWW
jgi:hypothetical protein